MGKIDQFLIPYAGLKDGVHLFKFEINNTFFQTLEHESLIKEGDFLIEVELDKRGNISTFIFEIVGKMPTNCDRCLTSISLPIRSSYVFHSKITEEDLDDENIISIKPEQTHIDLGHYIYEMIVLSIPINNVYNCENDVVKPCDEVVLAKYNEIQKSDVDIWSNLKDLRIQ